MKLNKCTPSHVLHVVLQMQCPVSKSLSDVVQQSSSLNPGASNQSCQVSDPRLAPHPWRQSEYQTPTLTLRVSTPTDGWPGDEHDLPIGDLVGTELETCLNAGREGETCWILFSWCRMFNFICMCTYRVWVYMGYMKPTMCNLKAFGGHCNLS